MCVHGVAVGGGGLFPLAEQKVSKEVGGCVLSEEIISVLGLGKIYNAEPFSFAPSDVSNGLESHVSSKDSCSPEEKPSWSFPTSRRSLAFTVLRGRDRAWSD